MVMEVVHEDYGEGQCVNHHYVKNTTPGGICAFCLQEKLGKLVSSSFPAPIFPTSSPVSSPTNRSELSGTSAGGAGTLQVRHVPPPSTNDVKRSRLPFVSAHGSKKKNTGGVTVSSDSNKTVFSRSKSTRTEDNYSPHKRGFWSFLHKHSNHKNITPSNSSSVVSVQIESKEKKIADFVVVDENENISPDDESTIDRKVSRSRSVGCGSRSFSGEFFERISTGFGDCTLRRVESQREGGKTKTPSVLENNGMKGRVKCGGIFSGFMVNSSSSSSSSTSSSYLVSSDNNTNSNNNNNNNLNVKLVSSVHGRSKSWGWAFASPMRAFGNKPYAAAKKRAAVSSKNATPNLNAMPSILG